MRSRTIRAVLVARDFLVTVRFPGTAPRAGAGTASPGTPSDPVAGLDQLTDVVLLAGPASGGDDDAGLAALDARASRPRVHGITTHAVAWQARPHHACCPRVRTRPPLAREPGTILKEGIAA